MVYTWSITYQVWISHKKHEVTSTRVSSGVTATCVKTRHKLGFDVIWKRHEYVTCTKTLQETLLPWQLHLDNTRCDSHVLNVTLIMLSDTLPSSHSLVSETLSLKTTSLITLHFHLDGNSSILNFYSKITNVNQAPHRDKSGNYLAIRTRNKQ